VNGEVVVVVCCCAYNRALEQSQYGCVMKRSRGVYTVWPSLERSTSGWFGGSTSFVVPMTGQDMMADRLLEGDKSRL
jgi:hypothetical protein